MNSKVWSFTLFSSTAPSGISSFTPGFAEILTFPYKNTITGIVIYMASALIVSVCHVSDKKCSREDALLWE